MVILASCTLISLEFTCHVSSGVIIGRSFIGRWASPVSSPVKRPIFASFETAHWYIKVACYFYVEKRNESWRYNLVFLCLIDSTYLRSRLYLRKVVSCRRVTRLPEVPWARANFPTFRVHLVIKLGKPLTWQTKVGSARRVYSPRLLFHPFSMTGSPT